MKNQSIDYRQFPIHSNLCDLKRLWTEGDFFVVVASPGAGKSTVLPLFILELLDGNGCIWHTQPRRVAALGVAQRLSEGLAESVGQTVGYKVRFDSKTSAQTRIHVVTDGILCNVLRDDPELSGIDVVILDEFHERSLVCDLNLALLREIQQSLRPDLKILILSATPDPKWERSFPQAHFLSSDGRQFPVQSHYLPTKPLDDFRAMVNVLADAPLDYSTLVFLPGIREIHKLQNMLAEDVRTRDRIVRTLYGQMSLEDQRSVVAEVLPGRIVLSTNLAETSLTLADVAWVVDSGWERYALHEPSSGLMRLESRRISLSSAIQRQGRAGRLRPGECFKMWTQPEEGYFRPGQVAEILDGDLSFLVMELSAWNYDPSQLQWVDVPPKSSWEAAQNRLLRAGLLEKTGQISEIGKRSLRWPFEPRLALLVEKARAQSLFSLGLALAVLLSERDPHLRPEQNSDLFARLEALQGADRSGHWNKSALGALRETISKLGGDPRSEQLLDLESAVDLLLSVFSDRVAKARKSKGIEYLMAMGRAAVIAEADLLRGSDYLLVATASYGQKQSQIRLALRLEESYLKSKGTWVWGFDWDTSEGFWAGSRSLCFGAVVLESQIQKTFPKKDLLHFLEEKWKLLKINELPFFEHLESNWQRLCFAAPLMGLALDDLQLDFGDHLVQFFDHFWSEQVNQQNWLPHSWSDLWISLLGWNVFQEWNRRFPKKWQSPAGHDIAVSYEGDVPVVSAPLQDFYGVEVHPSLDDGRIPLKVSLLSPAKRPLQLTMDLPNFWRGSYAEVRKEMKGRYPRHNWPEEPWLAIAGHRIKSRPPA